MEIKNLLTNIAKIDIDRNVKYFNGEISFIFANVVHNMYNLYLRFR